MKAVTAHGEPKRRPRGGEGAAWRCGAAAMRAGLALGLGLGLALLLAARRRRRAVREVLFFPSRHCCTEELLAEAEGRGGRPAPCPCPLPRADCSFSRLLRRLLSARRSLELCLFAFSSPELGRAVCVLHRRGVRVRVVTDSQYMALRGSQIGVLRLLGELPAVLGRAGPACLPGPQLLWRFPWPAQWCLEAGPAGGVVWWQREWDRVRCIGSRMGLMREGPLGLHTAAARPCSPLSLPGCSCTFASSTVPSCAVLCALWHRCCQMQLSVEGWLPSGHVLVLGSCSQPLATSIWWHLPCWHFSGCCLCGSRC